MNELATVCELPPPSDTIKHLAYAEAAVVLLECLMLELIERRILTSAELIGTVEDAISTKRRMIEEAVHPEISAVASGVLRTMANSLAASGRGRLK